MRMTEYYIKAYAFDTIANCAFKQRAVCCFYGSFDFVGFVGFLMLGELLFYAKC